MTDTVSVSLTGGRTLSPMQRGLWASQLASPDSPVQNMALLSHFDRPIDPHLLVKAFTTVVDASDVLRTRIDPGTGVIGLIAGDELPITEVVEVSREATAAWADERVGRPLDMATCGYDSAVIVHEDGSASWYLNLHHVITDATSSALVFQATAAAYHGHPPEFDSYYSWARQLNDRSEHKTDKAIERASRHWRDRAAAPRIGRLYQAVEVPLPDAERIPLDLDTDLQTMAEERLASDYRMLTDDLGWTTLLTTATALYCHRISGASEFSIGLPVHNRNDPTTRALIGPTMEVFPVDISIEPGDTHRSLHKRTGRAILNTLRHAIAGTSPSPDYEVVVNVIPRAEQQNFGSIPVDTRWIHADAIDATHLLRVQMTSYVAPTQAPATPALNGYEFALDVNNGVATEIHRDRVPGHYSQALRELVANPDETIGTKTLCGATELAELARWEHGADPTPNAPLLIERLESTLADNPEVVIQEGDLSVTGQELWQWVSATAAWLQSQGVVNGSRVGIELPRSIETVVAIMATIVSGGSFVPLDPAQPRARLDRLIERAQCHRVLQSTSEVLAVRSDTNRAELQSINHSGDDEAYLLYTSGSTGEPKGVPISHQGLAGYIQFALDSYTDTSNDKRAGQLVAPLFSALTFDLTITSLFAPILGGGKLVVIGDDGPQALAAIAAETSITWCKATPSHLRLLVRLLPPGHKLQTLVVGGEAFGTKLANELLDFNPAIRIYNEYGPTEAVVGCMIYEVEPELLAAQGEVPIGKPAPGVTLLTLDEHGKRVPIGAPGELCISHDGMTRGYLSTSEASDETTSPFVDIDGKRFYRSGDLVRLQDAERMVYLGRIDEQVKVGGIRLEPIEVEEALNAHPLVERSAVRLWSPTATTPKHHCHRCGLPDNVPAVDFDPDGICDTCHSFDRVAPVAESWFKNTDDLQAKLAEVRTRRSGDYDCLHLLSGGKDSTYALYRLVELGFKPYALTLDNGFISEGAKENVRRSIADLGIDHEFATSESMNAIFRDSLERYSNVCHGCYKTIYTLATNRAAELGIPLIVTGLSRGQLFETRLIPQQFSIDRFDPEAIDRAVLEARKTYHRIDDGLNRLLDTAVFESDELFEQVEYLDFYRYVDVELADMLDFLTSRAPWVRPADTGRSTNCLINAAGIHTHQTEQGYHNYAVPYAWDVRLGHKTRDEAIDELDDQLDEQEVSSMLAEVGYELQPRRVLTAWVELTAGTKTMPTPAEFRAFLSDRLPTHAIPSAFVSVEALPLTTNGKLDESALPAPRRVHRQSATLQLSPTTKTERIIVDLWERTLQLEPISVDDDFFALGGDSLAALEMVVALAEELGATLGEELAFIHTTPKDLAEAVDLTLTKQPLTEPDLMVDPTASELVPTPAGVAPELSAGELAILFDQSDQPDDVKYNVGRTYTVAGPVDGGRFEAALRAVAARHQPLSWSFSAPRRHLTSTEAVQVEVSEEILDADDSAQSQRLIEIVNELHRKPFDLENGPLLRCRVQPLAGGSTTIVLAIHHASGDAEGFQRLWQQIDDELTGHQPTRIDGSTDSLDADEFGYDYAAVSTWQRSQPSTEDERYWLEASGHEPAANLAMRRPNQPNPDGFVIKRAAITADQLRITSGSSGFAAVIAAITATLHRYSDGPNIELGMITSTRDHRIAQDLFGYLLNTVPLRVHCQNGDSFADLRDRSAAAIGGALAHRSYPQAKIRSDRLAAGQPAPNTDVMVAFDDLGSTSLAGVATEQRVLWNGCAVSDLTFFVEVRDDGVDLSLEYRGSRVAAATATDLLDRLDETLSLTIGNPSASIGQTLSHHMDDLVQVGPELTDATLVITRLLANTTTHPERLAVVCGQESLTWHELGLQARSFAARLADEGIGLGDRVVVCLPRSVELIAAIAGIHLAGASYVPVDPSYPVDRIKLIIETSGASVGMVTTKNRSLVSRAVVISPGSDQTEHHHSGLEDGPALASQVGPDHEAYVIFTSGSTGKPRGVPVSHGNLAASTNARSLFYDQDPERFLVISSAAFDSSIVGLFWTLATGGTIELPTDHQVHDVEAIQQLLERGDISHTLMVPTLYQAVLARHKTRTDWVGHKSRADWVGHKSRADWVGHVIVAGEACPPSLLAEHFSQAAKTLLTNEYGPTEATVWATAHHCSSDDAEVPIGRPIAGSWVAIVDADGAPKAAGVEGELIIGGPGVVAGYLHEPALTEAKFASLLGGLVSDGAERYFRTGDRAVIIDDTVHFLGRVDNQLNIGGARVEPEDIEAVLVEADGVAAALVTAVDQRTLSELCQALPAETVSRAMQAAAMEPDPAAALLNNLQAQGRPDVRLVAHIEGPANLDLQALRQRSVGALPQLHRPATYVIHRSLPRTPNGKLDREAAAHLDVPDSSPSADHPRSEAELDGSDDATAVQELGKLGDQLTGMFRQILRNPSFQANDSFFDHGGHSLLAMELLLAVEERFDTRLGATVLYDNPSPAELAEQLITKTTSSTQAVSRSFLVPIQPRGSRPPIFAIHVLGIDCEFFRPLAARLGDDQPMYGLGQPTATPDADAPTDVNEIASVYAEEINEVAPTGPISIAAISLGGVVAFELAQQLTAQGRDVALLALFDTLGPGVAGHRLGIEQRAAIHLDQLKDQGWEYLAGRLRFQGLKAKRLSEKAKLRVKEKLDLQPDYQLEVRRFVENNIQTQVAYEFEPYFGPMLLLKALDDPFTQQFLDIDLGWTDVALGPITIESAPGGHLSMMSEPHVEHVARAMETFPSSDQPHDGPQTINAKMAEKALTAGLRSGSLPSVIAKLQRDARLNPEGARLADDAARIAAGLSRATEEAARSVEQALIDGGHEARLVPIPKRLQHPSATITVSGDVEQATETMARSGFTVDDLVGPAARAALVKSQGGIDYIRRDAATIRIRLSWAAETDAPSESNAGKRAALQRKLQPNRSDFQVADLPAWAWPAYWPIRPYRVARDRLRARFDADGNTGGNGSDLGLFLGTPPGLIEPLLRFADAKADELLVDIGSGDGRVLIEAARRFGCRGRGYEIDGNLAEAAKQNVDTAGLSDLIDIHHIDAGSADLSDADIVFAFLPPSSVAAILESTWSELRPGSRLLSHEQLMSAWPRQPDQTKLLLGISEAEPGQGGVTVANLWFGPTNR